MRAQRLAPVQVGVGLDLHVRRVKLEGAHAELSGAAHLRGRVVGEARVHAAHGEQPVGGGVAVAGDVFVHPMVEAHQVLARVVDEHGALDAVLVEPPQQVFRRLHDLLQLVDVGAALDEHVEHLGAHVPPRLDVDVRVGDLHGADASTPALRSGLALILLRHDLL